MHPDCKSMDRGKKPSKLLTARNSKLYMDLKDIIREHALPFLPAKSLFRCQGVCRDWKLQIATPFFAHNQSLSFHGISGLFCQTPGNPPSFISVDPRSCGVPDPSLKFLPVPIDIRTSSNGLLCCQGTTVDKTYYICNPVTRQWKSLPKPNAVHGPDPAPAVVLIFEPSLLNFVAEYKLICAFPSADFDGATEFEIYSSKEGSWRVSGEICFGDRKLIPRSGVHVNGIVYWQTMNGSIVAFDLIKDRSQLIKGYSSFSSSLGVMEGSTSYPKSSSIVLCVLSNVHTNTMQMGSNVRTWKDTYTFCLDHGALGGAGYCHHGSGHASVLFVGDDVVLGRTGEVIYSYDMKKKETKALSRSAEFDMRVVCYVNNLVYL